MADPHLRVSQTEQHSPMNCRGCWDVLEMCVADMQDIAKRIQAAQMRKERHTPPHDAVKRTVEAATLLVRAYNEARQ